MLDAEPAVVRRGGTPLVHAQSVRSVLVAEPPRLYLCDAPWNGADANPVVLYTQAPLRHLLVAVRDIAYYFARLVLMFIAKPRRLGRGGAPAGYA